MFDIMQDFGGGPGGPMIFGEWTNKLTGEKLFVRDSIIDGDRMYLMTDKGQIDFQKFSNEYIQVSNDIYDLDGNKVGTQEISLDEIQQPQIDRSILLSKPLNTTDNITSINNNSTVEIKTTHDINNFDLIDKIFKKTNSSPEINLDIQWTDFPKTELKMLIDYFDVTTEDISKYINQHLCGQSQLIEAINYYLINKL